MNKQTIFSIVLFFLVSNYLSYQVGLTQQFYGQGAGSTKTDPTVAARSYGINQVLTYSATRFDLGVIGVDQPQRRTIRYQNKGAEKVTIVSAKASCQCTSVRLGSSTTLEPNQSGQMELFFNPALTEVGRFSVSVSVQYQERPQIDRLLVSGEVVAAKVP